MELAIQEVSTRKGRDPRECVLVAFGGAGPGHAARLAELLQIPTVLCPGSPGVASTLGLLSADIRSDFVQSVVAPVDDAAAFGRVAEVGADLKRRAWKALDDEYVPTTRRRYALSGDFRYARQQYAVNASIHD